MEIDLRKYDEISKIEKVLGELFKYTNLSEYNLYILNYENQILLILTIITILFKEHVHNEYLIEQLKETKPYIMKTLTYYNYKIEDLIQNLDEYLQEKNIKKVNKIINDYGKLIQQIIVNYCDKNKNYIQTNMAIELIVEKHQILELTDLNPFIINQFLQHNRLTEEEKILYDIIEYYDNCEENYTFIKELMIKNYPKDKLKKAIMFILNNVYQEILEDKNETENIEIKCIIENNYITNEDIINHFIKNDYFSSKYIEYFILYNIRINQGRLKELEAKPSYQYVKKRKS